MENCLGLGAWGFGDVGLVVCCVMHGAGRLRSGSWVGRMDEEGGGAYAHASGPVRFG